jgi:hypothetical protein
LDITSVLRAHGIGVGKKLVGDAQPSDVRAGKTFSNADGNDKVGALPVRSTTAQTITPGTSNQVLQAGIYDGDITILGDADLVASNIRSGVNIFGVVGTVVEGKRWASGTVTFADGQTAAVSGLSFRPSTIVAKHNGSADWMFLYQVDRGINHGFHGTSLTATAGVITTTSNGFSVDLKSNWGIGKAADWIAFE